MSGILLLLGIPTGWPYSYYILLRWVIFISSGLVSYGFYKSNIFGWALIFIAVAFFFNPIFPVYMNKSSWVIMDFIVAALFFLAAFASRKDKK